MTSADWDEQVDVVVAGAGGGITGAYTAAREALSVALIEATDKFGGTTAFSGGGGMWFPCNPVLRRAGCDDTIEDALAYFHAVVGDRTPRELQDAYVRGGARLIEYLEQDDGFAFKVLPWPDYFAHAPGARLDGLRHIVARSLPASALGPYADRVRGPLDNERLGAPAPELLTGGRALIGRFLAALRRFPHAAVHLDSPLTELVTDDGAVTGVIVRRNGEPVRIGARRGVLLAAGGFEQNTRMRRRLRRTRTRRRHDGRAGQHRCRTRSGHPHRGGHRPDGSGVVVTGTHPPRWPVDVLPLVHRRDLRQLRRQAVRQRVRPV
jgi:3-oxosteroid 1-dehydrogenase